MKKLNFDYDDVPYVLSFIFIYYERRQVCIIIYLFLKIVHFNAKIIYYTYISKGLKWNDEWQKKLKIPPIVYLMNK